MGSSLRIELSFCVVWIRMLVMSSFAVVDDGVLLGIVMVLRVVF